MHHLILVLICLVSGFILGRVPRFPRQTPQVLNAFIIHISLPALTLYHIQRMQPDPHLFYPLLAPLVLFLASAAFFTVLRRKLRLTRQTTAALILCGGFANTSFVGIPLIEAYYGHALVGIGVVISLSSFLIMSTFGVVVAAMGTASVTAKDVAVRIIQYPPFVALLAALALRPFDLSHGVSAILQALSSTLTPLALISVGFQVRWSDSRGVLREALVGLVFKLVIGPAVVALLLLGLLGERGDIVQVTIFEVAMAPMITAAIMSIDRNLAPPLTRLMASAGIPLSLATTALWRFFLTPFG